MRYELIEGSTKVMNQMVKDGWELVNTFANPCPQPYFFALMRHDGPHAEAYSVENVEDWAYRGGKLAPWIVSSEAA